ncbi:nicotinate-nucleotide--dimethylbenzimidazole phosphoribosyltransferase [Streptomyces fractus]|uniref:nicotinate-nucleotide--dimethylbenzimidazole phosphoribosyltransferase n=1 Tax=Streptomyces fractus TaxID=641806 RepID=UPI003CECBAA9
MTDTGQVPGEGLPEDAGTAEPPGVPAPGAYTYLDPSDATAEDDEILLMPGSQGAWGQQPTDHSQGQGQQYAPAPAQPRRPLHMGPAVPDTNGSPVRSLADRGPAQMPARQSGPPTTGPEYLDIPPQGAAPWQPAQAQAPAETVAPQYTQPEAPAHDQEFAQVGAYAYAAHEQGQGGYDYPQSPDYAAQGYAQQPAADQTLGQFVPVDGIVPTTPHLAPTPPQPMSVPPLPEEQSAQQHLGADEQYAAADAAGQAASGQWDAVDLQGAADQWGVANDQIGTGQQSVGDAYAVADPQAAAGQQAAPGQEAVGDHGAVPNSQAAAGQQVVGDPQAVAAQQALADQQVVGDHGAMPNSQATSGPQAVGDHPVPTDQQAVGDNAAAAAPALADQQAAGDHSAAADPQAAAGPQAVGGPQAPTDPQVVGDYAAATDPQAVAGQQVGGDSEALADQQVAGDHSAAADPQAAVGPQAVGGRQASTDQQAVGDHVAAADQQAVAGQQVAGDPQAVVDQQALADQQAAGDHGAVLNSQNASGPQAVGGHHVPTDQQALAGQQAVDDHAAGTDPQAAAGPQGAGDPQAAGGSQSVAGQQAVGDHAAVLNSQTAADPQAAGDHAAGTDPQAAAGPQGAGDPQAAGGSQSVAGQQAVADQQAVGGYAAVPNSQAAGDPQALADQQAVGDHAGVPNSQTAADEQAVGDHAAGTDSQAAAGPHGAGDPQALADPKAAGDHAAATDPQATADPQAAGSPQAVGAPQATANPQVAGDPHAVADSHAPADHHPVAAPQPVVDQHTPADQHAAPGQPAPAPHNVTDPPFAAAPQAAIDPQDPHAMANQQSAEQAPVGDEAVTPEHVVEWGTQGPESAEVTPEGAASVPAPREGDSGAIPLPESAHTEDPAEQTVAPAELTGEPEHLMPEPEAHPAAPAYDDTEREAVLRVMRERRDIRNGFRSDPIPHEVLLRVLEAAHTAPSVGHSQPWDFVVIRSADTRRAMHELAMRQKDAYAKSLPKGRAKQFKELKIEAILDTPVNIVVTADPTRGGRHTLGRHTQPQMAPYSSALAVENLWLAARAEGLGVGWVSFFDEREMVRSLGLPEHLEVVAYLCVGYVDEFPDEPELMQAGWSKRRPLSWVVHEETYGRRALPGEDPHDLLAETVSNIRPLDAKALGEAWERQKRMTKPAGALGMLEIISAQLSGLSRVCPPPIPEPAAVAIFAGDHGVHAQGVTPWPQEVTGQMVANFLGGGAVCNAFASQVGAEVCVIDVGVAGELPATPGLLPRKVRAGTADMTTGPALTREEVKEAIEVGIETARDLVAAGNKALLTGEMGIANTTASAALISVYTEVDPAEVTGRGTGINDETHARKVEVVRRALDVHKPDPADPIGVLSAVGGLEHAAMVGLLLGGASLRTPVILDGVSAGAAALVARAIAPEVLAACIAGHRSAEPGHVAALNKLGLRPLVDLDLRLGEGTGALLALPIVQSAARAMHEVATFDSAGVTEK